MRVDCFKAYDVRGRVPEELDDDIAARIGLAYAQEIRPGTVVIGYDARLESPGLARALSRGLLAGGARVIDIGLCGTEEVYFHTFWREREGVGGGIMVTASHNPEGYGGMKFVRRGARPVSGDSGLFAIRDRAAATATPPAAKDDGSAIRHEPDKSRYIDHLLGYVDQNQRRPLRIVANPGNGTAGPVIGALQSRLPFEFVLIQGEPDGRFPHGVPNPLLPEKRAATARAVQKHGADLGIAWDGDFDRCFFFDAAGRFIESYYLIGLLAEALLARAGGGRIVHDPRLTWNTIERVRLAGGVPVESKTGHAFIKERMRAEQALYGGEMSGHHYFRDFAYCDSGMIPWLLLVGIICRTGRPLGALVDDRIAAYPCSGELNFHVESASEAIERVERHYAKAGPVAARVDGLSLDFGTWRLNLRASNTEPLLRLNIESRGNPGLVERHVAEVTALIDGTPVGEDR